MPNDVAMIVAGVTVVFLIFAGALVWASIFTRAVKVPGATYFDGRQ